MNAVMLLPYEIVSIIGGHLSIDELIRFSRVCRHVYQSLYNDINRLTTAKKNTLDEIKNTNYAIYSRNAEFNYGNDFSLRIVGDKYTAMISRVYYHYWNYPRGYGLTQDYDNATYVLTNKLKMTVDWHEIKSPYDCELKFGLGQNDRDRSPICEMIDYEGEEHLVWVRGVKRKQPTLTDLGEFVRRLNNNLPDLEEYFDICVVNTGTPSTLRDDTTWEHLSGYQN